MVASGVRGVLSTITSGARKAPSNLRSGYRTGKSGPGGVWDNIGEGVGAIRNGFSNVGRYATLGVLGGFPAAIVGLLVVYYGLQYLGVM